MAIACDYLLLAQCAIISCCLVHTASKVFKTVDWYPVVVFQTGPAHEYIEKAVFESNGRNPEGLRATQPAATGNPAVNSHIPDSSTASIAPLPTPEPAT